MPDWTSPAELRRDADAFGKLMHTVLGIYLYVPGLSYGQRVQFHDLESVDMNGSSRWTLSGTLYEERNSSAGRWWVEQPLGCLQAAQMPTDFLLFKPVPIFGCDDLDVCSLGRQLTMYWYWCLSRAVSLDSTRYACFPQIWNRRY
jgi:hypothetical protein